MFDYEKDIVLFDLVLVMDKFTAADVLREVSVYDTIQKEKRYSAKVRRLGEFHPKLKLKEDVDGQDIDDPLYGNYGGESTKVSTLISMIFSLVQDPSGGGCEDHRRGLFRTLDVLPKHRETC